VTTSHVAEDRILGGERVTDGLWTHRGKLSVGPAGNGAPGSSLDAPRRAGDVNANRGDGTGVYYFGGRSDTYLFFNGTGFYFNGAQLIVPSIKAATDTGWTTPAFVNSWAAYADGNYGASCGYRKMPDGRVIMRGLIAGGPQASLAFTLPVGYRPLWNMIFATTNASGVVRCDVMMTGAVNIGVNILAGSWSNTFQSLNEISFLAEL